MEQTAILMVSHSILSQPVELITSGFVPAVVPLLNHETQPNQQVSLLWLCPLNFKSHG